MRLTISEGSADEYLHRIRRAAPEKLTLVGPGRNAGFAVFLGTELEQDGYRRDGISVNRRERPGEQNDLVEVSVTLTRTR